VHSGDGRLWGRGGRCRNQGSLTLHTWWRLRISGPTEMSDPSVRGRAGYLGGEVPSRLVVSPLGVAMQRPTRPLPRRRRRSRLCRVSVIHQEVNRELLLQKRQPTIEHWLHDAHVERTPSLYYLSAIFIANLRNPATAVVFPGWSLRTMSYSLFASSKLPAPASSSALRSNCGICLLVKPS
jgi:hypothetical protein